MTRAPRSARRNAQEGPARNWLKSRTSNPARGLVSVISVQLLQFIAHLPAIASRAQKTVNDEPGVLLKLRVSIETRPEIGVFQNRQRVLEIIVARSVDRPVFPGGAMPG